MKRIIAISLFVMLSGVAFAQNEGTHTYISFGESIAKSKATAKVSMAGVHKNDNVIDDKQIALKAAFGAQFSPAFRAEVFYQYRTEIEKSDIGGGVLSDVSAKMQDIGANVFYTFNPQNRVHVFVGAGLAATRVHPEWEANGVDLSGYLWGSKFFATPTGFLGVEFTDKNNLPVMDLSLFYSKTFINESFNIAGVNYKIKDISSCGLAFNFRFHL